MSLGTLLFNSPAMGLRYFRDWRSNIQWKGSIFGLFFLKENIILLKELMIVNIWWYILICCSNFLKVWHLHFYSASNESVNHRSIFNSCRFLGGVSLPYIYFFSQYLIAKSLKLSQIGWRAFVSIHFQIGPFDRPIPTHEPVLVQTSGVKLQPSKEAEEQHPHTMMLPPPCFMFTLLFQLACHFEWGQKVASN